HERTDVALVVSHRYLDQAALNAHPVRGTFALALNDGAGRVLGACDVAQHALTLLRFQHGKPGSRALKRCIKCHEDFPLSRNECHTSDSHSQAETIPYSGWMQNCRIRIQQDGLAMNGLP